VADKRVVSVKLEQIEQYHGELKEKQETLSREGFLQSTTEQRAVERMFENAIQACSDLAQNVATREFGFDGSTAKGAIRVLRREGVIDDETATTLVAAVGFRNVLAHEYGRVDIGEVYETLQTGLGVYDSYSRQIARWIRDREQTESRRLVAVRDQFVITDRTRQQSVSTHHVTPLACQQSTTLRRSTTTTATRSGTDWNGPSTAD